MGPCYDRVPRLSRRLARPCFRAETQSHGRASKRRSLNRGTLLTLFMIQNLQPRKPFFVGIDSDGAAFDTMDVKQNLCFTPNTIRSWGLQAVADLAREVATFVNLHSRWRGTNRFPALVMVLDLLADRPEALARGYTPPSIQPLRDWLAREKAPSNRTLADEVRRTGDAVFARTLAWSQAINADVAKTIQNALPFANAAACIEKLHQRADVAVVSAASTEALHREWSRHGIDRYVRLICGQEHGSKKDLLQHAVGLYGAGNVLMIGDAPADLGAASDAGAMFFPINPGREAASWRVMSDEGIARLAAGTFGGPYQDQLVEQFLSLLPTTPPWATSAQTHMDRH